MPRYRLTALCASDTILTASGEVHEVVCGNSEQALLLFGRELGVVLAVASAASPDYVMEVANSSQTDSPINRYKMPVHVIRSRSKEG